jgi:hypothetical protein
MPFEAPPKQEINFNDEQQHALEGAENKKLASLYGLVTRRIQEGAR